MRKATQDAGRPLPISLDEFTIDRGQKASHIPVDDADGQRREKLWPTYFSGGMIEFILEDLLKTDNFGTPQREKLWQYIWHARHFMEENLPFWEMEPADELASGGATMAVGIGRGKTVPMGPQVFAKRGEVYAVYLPVCTQTGTLDLRDLSGPAEQRWFNPRTGEFVGEAKQVTGGGQVELGAPPDEPKQDWVVLVRQAKLASVPAQHFPDKAWEVRSPQELGLDGARLDAFAKRLGGDGCIVRDGYLVKSWGHINRHGDWASAAKPVLSTLLLAAVHEGRLKSVDALVKDAPWPLSKKDASMTYRHLANMVSGYALPEPPGKAWGYNDLAIELYARSLEKVFGQTLNDALHERLEVVGLEDGGFFGSRHGRGVSATPRDFARLGWLWLNEGQWNGREVLPSQLIARLHSPGSAGRSAAHWGRAGRLPEDRQLRWRHEPNPLWSRRLRIQLLVQPAARVRRIAVARRAGRCLSGQRHVEPRHGDRNPQPAARSGRSWSPSQSRRLPARRPHRLVQRGPALAGRGGCSCG